MQAETSSHQFFLREVGMAAAKYDVLNYGVTACDDTRHNFIVAA